MIEDVQPVRPYLRIENPLDAVDVVLGGQLAPLALERRIGGEIDARLHLDRVDAAAVADLRHAVGGVRDHAHRAREIIVGVQRVEDRPADVERVRVADRLRIEARFGDRLRDVQSLGHVRGGCRPLGSAQAIATMKTDAARPRCRPKRADPESDRPGVRTSTSRVRPCRVRGAAARRRRPAARCPPRSTSARSPRPRGRRRCRARGPGGLAHQPFAEFEAVGDAGDAKKDVHRPGRRRGTDAGNRVQLSDQKIARGAVALERMRDRGLAVVDRDDGGALHERRRARGVVFDQLAQVGQQRVGRDDPAEPPSGHQPGLGKAVGADDAIAGLLKSRNDGAQARAAGAS